MEQLLSSLLWQYLWFVVIVQIRQKVGYNGKLEDFMKYANGASKLFYRTEVYCYRRSFCLSSNYLVTLRQYDQYELKHWELKFNRLILTIIFTWLYNVRLNNTDNCNFITRMLLKGQLLIHFSISFTVLTKRGYVTFG